MEGIGAEANFQGPSIIRKEYVKKEESVKIVGFV
jgi:hypothetical protein